VAFLALLVGVLSAAVGCVNTSNLPRPVVQRAHRVTPAGAWVAGWSASAQAAVPGSRAASGLARQTVRDIVFTSAGGTAVRLVVSNAFGTRMLRVGAATVAVAGKGASVAPGTMRQVRFGGSPSVDIPPGGQALSDPVAIRVPALHDLAVSLYLPARSGPATVHRDAQQVSWLSKRGNHAADPGGGSFTARTLSWYYLAGVLVWSPRAAGTVVVLGDSITDGMHSAIGANARWPDDLARRLAAVPGRTLAVADAGISGNRVLTDARCCGVSGEARFTRDALGQPGVKDIIVLEGINDFGDSARRPSAGIDPVAAVTAAAVIAGYRRLIALAHSRGLRIFGATLLPFQGAGYYRAAGEAKREAVNAWIRDSGAFDGVIDFDKVMRDPADRLRLNPAYDSGDHLHPNDAGYRAMADAVSLRMLLAGLSAPAAPQAPAAPDTPKPDTSPVLAEGRQAADR
jgi:lysophospholipase L1-like esterase